MCEFPRIARIKKKIAIDKYFEIFLIFSPDINSSSHFLLRHQIFSQSPPPSSTNPIFPFIYQAEYQKRSEHRITTKGEN